MAKKFNMEMNIAKAIGIIAIVAGHTLWPILGEFLYGYFWHVPLFFFISGYFFNETKSLFFYLIKTLFNYMGLACLYELFYSFVSLVSDKLFNRVYGDIPTLSDFWYAPLTYTPFDLSAPNWFLFQLAISLLLFAIIIFTIRRACKNIYLPFIVFLPLALLAVLFSKPDFQPMFGLNRVLIRTGVTMFYIYAGYLYKNRLERIVKFNVKWFLWVIVIHAGILLAFNNCCSMNIHQAMFYHNFSPFITPFLCIYIVLFISKLLAPLVKEGSFIDKVGKNSLHIMANHLFVIFLIEILIFLIDGISFSELPQELIANFYKMDKYKYLYTICAVVCCTYLGELFKYLKIRFKNFICLFLSDLQTH